MRKLISRPGRRQRGLSLVELMVGIAVGLFIAAAAATLAASQLSDNRRLLLEIQVQQDLRAAADIMIRDLRRAGAWGSAEAYASYAGVAPPDGAGAPNLTQTAINISGSPANSEIQFWTVRTQGTVNPYGYKLSNNTVLARDPTSGNWQELTDKATMQVTSLVFSAQSEPAVRAPCPKLCADGTQDCWPTVVVRSITVDITGKSASDDSVVRSVRASTRVRNDRVDFNDPSGICPP